MDLLTEEYNRYQAQAERFRLLAKANGVAAAIWTSHGGVWVSSEFTELTGFGPDQLPNCTEPANRADVRDALNDWLENVHVDDRDSARAVALDYFLLRKGGIHKDRYRLLCGNGEYLLMDVAGVSQWENNKIISVDFTLRAVKQLEIKIDKATATAAIAEATSLHTEATLAKIALWAKRVVPAIAALVGSTVAALSTVYLSFRSSLAEIEVKQEKIEEVVEDSSNLKLASDVYEASSLNAKAPEIALALRSKSDFADLVFIGAYYPKDIPQRSVIFAQYRRSPKTPWLSREPFDVRNTDNANYKKAAHHFSPKGSEVYQTTAFIEAPSYTEYTVAGRLPVDGWQPFFVGMRLPASAPIESHEQAKAELLDLQKSIEKTLENNG